jgi:hypothetical protein
MADGKPCSRCKRRPRLKSKTREYSYCLECNRDNSRKHFGYTGKRERNIRDNVCFSCEKEPRIPGTNNCRTWKRLCVDHDHKTNKVRALLCDGCNKGLGAFSDSPALLRKAADYLEF